MWLYLYNFRDCWLYYGSALLCSSYWTWLYDFLYWIVSVKQLSGSSECIIVYFCVLCNNQKCCSWACKHTYCRIFPFDQNFNLRHFYEDDFQFYPFLCISFVNFEGLFTVRTFPLRRENIFSYSMTFFIVLTFYIWKQFAIKKFMYCSWQFLHKFRKANNSTIHYEGTRRQRVQFQNQKTKLLIFGIMKYMIRVKYNRNNE